MENLPAEQMKVTAAILNLGLSYLRPIHLEENEEEKSQQIHVPNTILEDSKGGPIRFTENIEYNNEEKILFGHDYDKNKQQKSDNKVQVGFGKAKPHSSKEENFYKKTKRKKLNEFPEILTKKHFNLYKENHEKQREASSEMFEDCEYLGRVPKCYNDVQKEIINEVREKVSGQLKSNKNTNVDRKDNQEEEKKKKFINYAKELISKLKCKESCDTDFPRNLFHNALKLKGQNEDLKKDVQLELNNEKQQRLGRKVIEELDREKIKNPEEGNEIEMEVDLEFQQELGIGVQEDLDEEKLKKPEQDNVIEMEVDSEFQQELDMSVCEELTKKKQTIFKENEGVEINAHSEFQEELDDRVHEEHIKERKLIHKGNEEIEINTHSDYQSESKDRNMPEEVKGNQKIPEENNEEDEDIQLDLEFTVDPELRRQLGDVNLQLYIQFEDDSESQNSFDDEFLEDLREKNKMSGIEVKVNNCVQIDPVLRLELHEKIQKEPSEEMQQGLNLEEEIQNEYSNITQQMNESKIHEESNKNVEFNHKKQEVTTNMQQIFDKEKHIDSEIEPTFSKKVQELYDKVREEFEKIEKEFEHKEPEIDINNELDINEHLKLDSQLRREEFQRKIDQIQNKICDLKLEIDEESEKKLIEEIQKVSTPVTQIKALKGIWLSLQEQMAPIEERIELICKSYFPPEMALVRKNDDKKQINELLHNLENTFVRKGDEVQSEFRGKVSTDSDSDVNYEEEISRHERLDDEMQENCSVTFEGTSEEEEEEVEEEEEEEEEDGDDQEEDLDIEGAIQENYEDELQKDLDVEDKLKKDIDGELDEVQENFKGELDDIQEDYKRESDEEDSYVDVEGFDEEEIQHEFVCQPVPEAHEEFLIESEEDSEEESEGEFRNYLEVNEVTEIVEDYLIEKSVEEFTSTEERSAVDESSVTETKFHSAEELNTSEGIKETNEEVQQTRCDQGQAKLNENVEKIKRNIEEQNYVKMQREFNDFLENMHDLNEIPSVLKIEKEQIDSKLYQRFSEFQEYFYKTFKQEYDRELKICNSFLSTCNEQQQFFYELKKEFYKIKEEYKSFVVRKFLEDLQQKVDNKGHFLDIEEFPEEFNDNLFPQIDEHIDKEFAELECDCNGIEPEFKYNVPLVFEENGSSKNKLKEKPYNLFEKLYLIHQKKLCEFAESTKFPENYLYPSSLLDKLFDDPSEENPNVIVITLYPIVTGYSLKISMNKNELPDEIFFNYATDTVLEYIEKERLPPQLMGLFDRAEPSIFYSGCVIAEIHDQIKDRPYVLGRILLRPSNESILSDVNLIIAQNSSIDWTYEKRLLLESKLLKLSYPVMCMDILPSAGLTVQFQHQLLSSRIISLNPLNDFSTSTKLKPLETDDFNEGIFSSKTSNELPKASSKIMDSASDGIHKFSNESQKVSSKIKGSANDSIHMIWKFDFRVESVKMFKLYVLCIAEIQEFSLLWCMNLESDVIMRVKINLQTNKIKSYISMILDILKQKINPNIEVFRRYKNDGKSPNLYLRSVPLLLNEKMYEPSYADISAAIELFLEIKSINECDKTKSTTTPTQSSNVTLKATDGTKKTSSENEKVNDNNIRNIHLLSTKNVSKQKKFGLLNMNQRGQKISTIEILPTTISVTENILSGTKPIEIFPISNPLLITPSASSTIIPSVLSSTDISDIAPSVSNPVTVISSLPSLITVISSVPSHITVVSSTTSKVSTSETSSIDDILAPKNSSTFEDNNVNIGAELEPITLAKTVQYEHLNENDDNAINLFDNVESKLPTIYDIMKTVSDTNVTQSLSSQSLEKTKLIKHVHENGICLRRDFPKHTVNMEAVPYKSIILQRNISVDQTTSNPQLDYGVNSPKFSDLANLEEDLSRNGE